jgi:hypothetical protein
MVAVYTSITMSYLAKARVLAKSVKCHNPDFRFYLVLAEPAPKWLVDGIAAGREPFDRLISIDDLPIANKSGWRFGLDVVECCTGVKAMALKLLQEEYAEEQVIYLDPDIVVFNNLNEIVRSLREYSILLTPHCPVAETETEAIVCNEISSLAHGVYNLGFIAVASDGEGKRLARWWSQRLQHFCHNDIPNGLFTDQRWIDLVPAQFAGVKILRDAVYNVASWNITQRRVSGTVPDAILCDGRPLAFYHFSGINERVPQGVHRRFDPQNRTLADLVRWYLAECARQGDRQFRHSRWQYSCYEDGTPITRAQRLQYRASRELQSRFRDPFRKGPGSYYDWLTTEGPGLESLERQFPQTLEGLRAAADRLRRIENSRAYKVYVRFRRWLRAA